MSDALVIALIGLIAAPLAALITWLANRRKNVSEIYSALTESSQSAVETMQSTMETLHDELISAQSKIEELIIENQKMREEIAKLRHQNVLLLEENHALHSKIDGLMKAFQISDSSSSEQS